MNHDLVNEMTRVEEEWARAIINNDANAIGQFMVDDWTITGTDGNVIDKATFLGLVRSGDLAHDVMEFDDIQVRGYGDTAVVTARSVSGGKYLGHPFREVERSSDVFVKQEGRWRCISTYLSRITPTGSG